MPVTCREIAEYLEEYAPHRLAEEWDNVGLLLGSFDQEIKRIITCLDVTEEVVEEAVKIRADLILSHHPFIFKGVKRINEKDIKGKLIYRLVKNDIGVYSAHTNLDTAEKGLTQYLAETLGLKDIQNLKDYKPGKLFKVVVFVPEESCDAVRDSITGAGAGWIGKYSDCTFAAKGIGTFRPLEGTTPYKGRKGELEKTGEYRLETIVPKELLDKVISAMLGAHPYEEAAYDIYPLELSDRRYGYGKVGILEEPRDIRVFIKDVKNALCINNVKLIGRINNNIKRVAVFNGSFDESILDSLKNSADVLVTGDVKYHAARDIIDNGMCVIDAGHFGTERIVVKLLKDILEKRFKDIEVISNTVEADPFIIS